MMLPILISVSVAPTSYCFCASAVVEVAARIVRAAEKNPRRKRMAGILTSLVDCVASSYWKRLLAPARIQYPSEIPGNKKPPANRSGRRYSVEPIGLTDPLPRDSRGVVSNGFFHASIAEVAADDVA